MRSSSLVYSTSVTSLSKTLCVGGSVSDRAMPPSQVLNPVSLSTLGTSLTETIHSSLRSQCMASGHGAGGFQPYSAVTANHVKNRQGEIKKIHCRQAEGRSKMTAVPRHATRPEGRNDPRDAFS